MAELMQATNAFSCSLDSAGRVPFAVGVNDIFAADDEVVRRYPDNFRPVRRRDSAEVRRPLPAYPGAGEETATAGPGERRSLTRPGRRADKTAAQAAPAPAPTVTTTGPSEV
jgi:hypothetical protein